MSHLDIVTAEFNRLKEKFEQEGKNVHVGTKRVGRAGTKEFNTKTSFTVEVDGDNVTFNEVTRVERIRRKRKKRRTRNAS